MGSSVIRIICPNLRCRSVLAVPGSTRGKMVRCRNCGMRVKVPDGQPQKAGSGNAAASQEGQAAG